MRTVSDLINLRAYQFAKEAHGDQLRKYTEEPYVLHCLSVASILLSFDYVTSFPITLYEAALLHDTIEDTSVTYEDLVREFGPETASLVLEVTDVSRPQDGNRATRKKLDRIHLSRSSVNGANIKLADILDNTPSILAYGKGFASVYLDEAFALLNVLEHGNSYLYDTTANSLRVARAQLVASQSFAGCEQ